MKPPVGVASPPLLSATTCWLLHLPSLHSSQLASAHDTSVLTFAVLSQSPPAALPHAQLYLDHLPSSDRYYKSFMHRDTVNSVVVTK